MPAPTPDPGEKDREPLAPHVADVLFVLVRTSVGEVYGGEKSTLATAAALAREGVSPRFLLTAADDMVRETHVKGLECDVVPVQDPFGGFRRDSWSGKLRRFRDVLRVSGAVWKRARRADGLVVHANAIPGFFSAWLGATIAGAPLIYHIRTASHMQRTRWFEERAVLLSSRTIAVSESLRRQIVDTGHRFLRSALADRIQVVHNGFDFREIDAFVASRAREASRRKTGPAPDRISVVLVGGIFVDKGQLRFLQRVFPRVVEAVPEIHLTLIGGVKDPDYSSACRRAVQDLGLENHVTFTGYLPQDDVHAWLHGADIAVLPSEREGLPRFAIEAQAFGLPVVATAVVGSVEAVDDGVTGYLVPNERIEDMVDPLIRLARDPSLRVEMGRRGAARVRNLFSLERNVRSIRRIYDELLGRT